MKKLDCLPIGICSWSYRIHGFGENRALIEMDRLGEGGSIQLGEAKLFVHKPSFMQSRWFLKRGFGGGSIFEAEKASLFSRTIEIRGGGNRFDLTPGGIFTRSYTLSGPGVSCEISPHHAFTRRATITGRWDDFQIVAFGFWLAALMWRRHSNSGAGAG